MPHSIKTYQTKRKLKIYPDIIIGRGTIILLVTVTLLFSLAIIWLNHSQSLQHVWSNYIVDKKVLASFCEKTGLSNPVRQPINTFSNIIYLIIAIVILKKSWEERYSSNTLNLITANKTYSFIFGFILLYVFGASTFYHASLINLAHKLDHSSVFCFTLFPVMFFLNRWWFIWHSKYTQTQKRGSIVVFISTFLITNILLAILTPKGNQSVTALILILIFLGSAIATTITEPDNPKRNNLILSIVSVPVALVWFEFDKYKVLCNPKSYFQLHSLWNLFIGISAFYFFLYMHNEYKPAALINNDRIKKESV